MFYGRLRYVLIILIIFSNILFATELKLTSQEKEFIKAHPSIVLGTDKSWTPYVIVNKDGSITGYDQEVLNLINQLTGANFKLKADKWHEVVEDAKHKIIDGISTGSVHQERKIYFNSSTPYVTLKYIFVTSNTDDKKHLKSLNDINGKTIGIQKDNLVTKQLIKRFKNSKIIEYANYSEIIKALVTDEIDLTLIADHLSIFYTANELKIPFLRPIGLLDEEVSLVFSIRKDYPEAITIINKALAYIGEEKLKEIKNKWFIGTLNKSKKKLILKKEELTYLSNKKEIKMCIDPNWMPLEKIEHDKTIGFTSDFIKLLSQKINTPISLVPTSTWSESLNNIKSKKCDILSMVATTPKFEKYMDFTSPYLTLQIVLATKTSAIYINNLENKLDKTFAVVKNYALHEYLKSKYPTIKIVEVDSIHDGLQRVANREIFGYIDNSAVITHEIQQKFFSTVAITGQIDLEMHYSIGTRNDEKILNTIFEKTISSVNNSQKQDIKNRWFKFKQESMIDYKLIRNIIIIFLLLSLIGATFLIIFRKKNQKLKIAQKKIEMFNNTLEQQVKKELEKNRQQQLMIVQQSRLAQMGKAINMIAHQWRQPLNIVNGLVMQMDMKLSKQNNIDKYLLEKEFDKIEATTKYMSRTIDDFRDFFKPQKEKTIFSLKETINDAIRLLQPVMLYDNIKIHHCHENDIELFGYPNEIGQVIINLLNNAQDALISNNLDKEKNIYISLSKKDDKAVMTIQDNAGGINNKIINHIFDPYFSTKSNKHGTGLGLYIAKMIIEEHMDGDISVKNSDNGAVFKIEFKI